MSYQNHGALWRDIFLDRDGVINENRADHVKSWAEFHFLPGALEALRLLTERRYRVFIVTNQGAINRGLLTRAALEEIHRRMCGEVEAHGGRITGIGYCPHRPDEACRCRKPRAGMLLTLANAHRIDLRQACLIGDAVSDMAAGQAVGCRTIMVRTGRGAQQLGHADFRRYAPEHVADNLLDAVHWLGARPRRGHAGRHTPIWTLPRQPGNLFVEPTGTS